MVCSRWAHAAQSCEEKVVTCAWGLPVQCCISQRAERLVITLCYAAGALQLFLPAPRCVDEAAVEPSGPRSGSSAQAPANERSCAILNIAKPYIGTEDVLSRAQAARWQEMGGRDDNPRAPAHY